MDQQRLLDRCQQLSGAAGDGLWTAEDAIGFFQSFRPDGTGLADVFSGVPHGEELRGRLRRVFAASGDGRRPDGTRDAYFIVRRPASLAPDLVETTARRWLANLVQLDGRIGSGALCELLQAQPSPHPAPQPEVIPEAGPEVRVLEGKPPKHPRDLRERPRLLTEISTFSERFIEPLRPPADAALGLRRAYYFIACDPYLRDHLLWPLYRDLVGMDDPLEPYFTLWEHGIKYRIFNDQQIDFYIPRPA